MRAPNSNLLQPGGGFLLHRHAGLAPTIMQPHSQLNGAAFPAEETAAKYLFGAEPTFGLKLKPGWPECGSKPP
jgi:hypothetical protein